MKFRLLVAVFIWLIPSFAFAADSYLCISEMAIGFNFLESEKKWIRSRFEDGKKYIIKRPEKAPEKEAIPWQVVKFDSHDIEADCSEEIDELGNLICGNFKMNVKTRRFLNAHIEGYFFYSDIEPFKPSESALNEKDAVARMELIDQEKKWYEAFKEGVNVPDIEIGRCSPLHVSDQ